LGGGGKFSQKHACMHAVIPQEHCFFVGDNFGRRKCTHGCMGLPVPLVGPKSINLSKECGGNCEHRSKHVQLCCACCCILWIIRILLVKKYPGFCASRKGAHTVHELKTLLSFTCRKAVRIGRPVA
jgi:hypothetical protein